MSGSVDTNSTPDPQYNFDTPLADLVEELLSTGLPVDTVMKVVRAAERAALVMSMQHRDPVAEKRRAYDRDRKRRQRLSTGLPVEGNVHRISTGHKKNLANINNLAPPKQVLPPYISLSLSSSIEEIRDITTASTGHPVDTKPKPKRGKHDIPECWQPNDKHYALGKDRGFDKPAVDTMADAMRDWSASGGHRKADWDATFRNWIRNDKRQQPSPTTGNLFRPRPIGGGFA